MIGLCNQVNITVLNWHVCPLELQILPKRVEEIIPQSIIFIKEGGEDEIYTLPDANDKNNRLIKDTAGCKNYCRQKIKFHHSSFSQEQFWELPTDLSNYNREGIAEYKKGSFIVNDRIHARKAVQIYVALFTIYEIG